MTGRLLLPVVMRLNVVGDLCSIKERLFVVLRQRSI
jgi:hypothetical protein